MNLKISFIGGILIIIIAIIFFALNASQTGLATLNDNQSIKIGYLGPLTGDIAAIGQGQIKAIQLAVDEINSNNGINGKKIELIVEDGACDGAKSTIAATKLIDVDKVNYIIGGQCSSETLAIAPIAEKNKVILLSPLSSNPDITNSGDYIFRNYPSDTFQGKIAAEYIKNNLKKNNAAILSCLSDWCVGLKNEFKKDYEALGGKVSLVEEFTNEETNLRPALTKIKNSNAEIVYFLAYTNLTINAIKQKNELGIMQEFFGGDSFEDTTIWNEVGAIAENTKYVVPKDQQDETFKTKFNSKYPGSEIVLAATNNYDAVYLLKGAIETVGDDSSKVKDYFYSMKPYKGISGTVEFDPNGDLKTAEYVVKEIINGKAQIIN